MHHRAYQQQCRAEEQRHTVATAPIRRPRLTLFALALGTFAIGTGEFGSNGIIQLFAADLGVSVPVATRAITAYAVGVMLGSPAPPCWRGCPAPRTCAAVRWRTSWRPCAGRASG